MAALHPSAHWTRLYAAVLLLYCFFLLSLGAWFFPVQTHGGPAGMIFLFAGVILAPMVALLWRGHAWSGVVAFVLSLYPAVWPLLWTQIVKCAEPLGRWVAEVSLLVVSNQFFGCVWRTKIFLPWFEVVMLLAPATFAALMLASLLAARKDPVGARP